MKKVKSKKTDLNAASLKLVGKVVAYKDKGMSLRAQSSALKLTDPTVSNSPYSNTLMKH